MTTNEQNYQRQFETLQKLVREIDNVYGASAKQEAAQKAIDYANHPMIEPGAELHLVTLDEVLTTPLSVAQLEKMTGDDLKELQYRLFRFAQEQIGKALDKIWYSRAYFGKTDITVRPLWGNDFGFAYKNLFVVQNGSSREEVYLILDMELIHVAATDMEHVFKPVFDRKEIVFVPGPWVSTLMDFAKEAETLREKALQVEAEEKRAALVKLLVYTGEQVQP